MRVVIVSDFFRVKISENHTSRISLSRGGGVTEELMMELEVVCDLSPLLCVCVCECECSYSALLVTP